MEQTTRIYRYRLYPTTEQEKEIIRIMEVLRRYYNALVEEKAVLHQETGIWKKKLPSIEAMEEFARKNNVDKKALELVRNNFENAFGRFRWIYLHNEDQYKEQAKGRNYGTDPINLSESDLKGFPEKKSQFAAKKTYQLLPSQLLWQMNRVMLPQIGWVSIKLHRFPPEDAKMIGCTVLWKSTGKFYLVVKFKINIPDTCYTPTSEEALGVVFVPRYVAARSDGVPVMARCVDSELDEKIDAAYKVLCRRTPGSKRYEEQRRKLARLIEKRTAQRLDAKHKASRAIVDTGKAIGIQVPEVKKMARQLKEQGLGDTIREDAWYQFYSQICYKAKEKGQFVNPVYRISCAVNRTCSLCGMELDQEPETVIWRCPCCKSNWIKHLNAAKNVQRWTEECIQEWRAASERTDE